MNQEDIFIKVINKINSLGFPYMLTGGMAVLFYGKPRTTHDIDIVVEINEENIPGIMDSFKDDFYISEEGIDDAISHRTMFNRSAEIPVFQDGDECVTITPQSIGKISRSSHVLLSKDNNGERNFPDGLRCRGQLNKGTPCFSTGRFNIIHPETGIKIDFWLLKNVGYDKVIFQRRLKKEIFGKEVYISAPEDTIIRKLLWFKESDISKHFDDVAGILQIQEKKLDYNYIEKWAKELDIWDVWEKAKTNK